MGEGFEGGEFRGFDGEWIRGEEKRQRIHDWEMLHTQLSDPSEKG